MYLVVWCVAYTLDAVVETPKPVRAHSNRTRFTRIEVKLEIRFRVYVMWSLYLLSFVVFHETFDRLTLPSPRYLHKNLLVRRSGAPVTTQDTHTHHHQLHTHTHTPCFMCSWFWFLVERMSHSIESVQRQRLCVSLCTLLYRHVQQKKKHSYIPTEYMYLCLPAPRPIDKAPSGPVNLMATLHDSYPFHIHTIYTKYSTFVRAFGALIIYVPRVIIE